MSWNRNSYARIPTSWSRRRPSDTSVSNLDLELSRLVTGFVDCLMGGDERHKSVSKFEFKEWFDINE